MTRDPAFKAEGAQVVGSLEDAIDFGRKLAAEIGVDEVCIIGGGNIYAQGLPLADVVHLTRVLATIDGDTYFPEIDSEVWHAISTENVPAGEKTAIRHAIFGMNGVLRKL